MQYQRKPWDSRFNRKIGINVCPDGLGASIKDVGTDVKEIVGEKWKQSETKSVQIQKADLKAN